MIFASDFSSGWLRLLHEIIAYGDTVGPRGQGTLELTDVTFRIAHPLHNILVSQQRNLGYKFLVAEWLWIYFGHEDVETIVRYNKNIAQFSDDGKLFFGAYGPRVRSRWPYLKERLTKDRVTRQAVIIIPREEAFRGLTKDEPCTLSIQFLIRKQELHTIVTMRSSDVWLGLPYDFFNFSMLANTLAAEIGTGLGPITFHLGSSHLYDRNQAAAARCLGDETLTCLVSPRFIEAPPQSLDDSLRGYDMEIPSYPWNIYRDVLRASTNDVAYNILRDALHES